MNRLLKKSSSLFGILLLVMPVAAQELNAVPDANGVLVREGSQKVLYYRKLPASLEGAYERANYIHPLYGLDGAVLTEDFPEDHRHHRGIFWAWHQVLVHGTPMGDSWECKDFIWEVDSLQVSRQGSALRLQAQTLWKSPYHTGPDNLPKAFLREQLALTVHPHQDNYRVLDFEISLRALEPEVEIGGSEDHKGYGGFSVRMKLPEDLSFLSANGPVEPQEGAVSAAPWMDMAGSLGKDDTRAGVMIISMNPWDQDRTPWILRSEKSMQNPVYPGKTPVPVSDVNPTVLRYRLVVYRGELAKEILRNLLTN